MRNRGGLGVRQTVVGYAGGGRSAVFVLGISDPPIGMPVGTRVAPSSERRGRVQRGYWLTVPPSRLTSRVRGVQVVRISVCLSLAGSKGCYPHRTSRTCGLAHDRQTCYSWLAYGDYSDRSGHLPFA